MRSFLPDFGFPLLTKELQEQSQRRRTYVLRTIAAVLIYILVLFVLFWEIIAKVRSPIGALGVGKDLLYTLFNSATCGIYIVVPIMTCVAIAGERERNTWDLLRVTRLGDSVILLEKYLSCSVAACTFLILSIPIMVIAYPLGGITSERILDAIWCLFLSSLLVAAVGICCSAWTRTMIGALLSTYLLLIAWYFVPYFVLLIFFPGLRTYDESFLHRSIVYLFPFTSEGSSLPWFIYHAFNSVPPTPSHIVTLAYYSIPTILQIGLFLFFARLGVVRTLDSGGVSFWRSLFVRLDACFKKINQNRFTKGREIFTHRGRLPVEHPLEWRESNRVLFNHPVYRIRLFVCMLAIFTGIMAVVASEGVQAALAIVYAVFILLGCIVLSINCAGVISRERSSKTLDVLLAVPIEPQELLHDKLAGARYWYAGVVAVSSLILIFRVYLSVSQGAFIPILLDVATICFLPRLVIWVSVAVGLRIAGYMRGIMTALAILGVWFMIGILVMTFGSGLGGFLLPISIFGSATSPLFLSIFGLLCPIYLWNDVWGVSLILGNILFYRCIGTRLKWWCEKHIGESLGRLEDSSLKWACSPEIGELLPLSSDSRCEEVAT